MKRASAIAVAALALAAVWAASRPADIPFNKHTLDLGANETVAFADVNGDKRLDIVSGENWYEAPKWTKRKFRSLPFANNYIDDFSVLPLDVNGDGRMDMISCSWFSKRIAWYENPGAGGAGMWKDHEIYEGAPVEFCFLVDLDNDGQARELLPQFGNPKTALTWFEFKNGKTIAHEVNPMSHGHGIGAGDVNGDGRNDILVPKGWLEAPADPRTQLWYLHADFPDDKKHLSFMYVFDVNGDGRNDVVASNAHDYGIFWMERTQEGKWTKRVIDDSWSQGHAVTLVDLNGDGRKDLLTGKRYMAHNGRDPGEREPLGLYWYESMPNGKGGVEWVRHIVDYATRTGGGMQLPVADIDGDGDLDFAAAGKSGLYLFENLTRSPGAAAPKAGKPTKKS